MSPTMVGMMAFSVAFSSALAGMLLSRMLPPRHLDDASKDTIKLGVGFIATMTALVLGLVTASAKSSFDEVSAAVRHSAIEVLALDRALARFGDETLPIRARLKESVSARIDALWPRGASLPGQLDPNRSAAGAEAERVSDAIRRLVPRDDAQRALQTRAVDLAESLLQTRWMALAGGVPSVPGPFLAVLLVWIGITFTSYGLFAPRHATVLAVLFACAASVGAALFLVLELDSPFEGLLRVSPEPLRQVVVHLAS